MICSVVATFVISRIHSIVRTEGSLEVAWKEIVDETIPTFMSRLWILRPIWFDLFGSDGSCSHSKDIRDFDLCKRKNDDQAFLLDTLKKQKTKIDQFVELSASNFHSSCDMRDAQLFMRFEGKVDEFGGAQVSSLFPTFYIRNGQVFSLNHDCCYGESQQSDSPFGSIACSPALPLDLDYSCISASDFNHTVNTV
ncbi:hypothetical protein PTKIN_Ptkin13bG0019200 [Pterospermum kingtungense]